MMTAHELSFSDEQLIETRDKTKQKQTKKFLVVEAELESQGTL